MTALNKQALREAANAANIASWGKWESYKPHKGSRGYEVRVGAKAVAQHCLKVDSAFIAAANPATVLTLLDELEAAERRNAETNQRNTELVMKIEPMDRRIAELEAREVDLPPTFWYEHDDLSHDIPVLDKRLVKKALRAAGIGVKGE